MNKRLAALALILLTALFCGMRPAWPAYTILDQRESTSYIITSDKFASSTSEGSSNAYLEQGILHEEVIGTSTSNHYIVHLGLLSVDQAVIQSVSISSISPNKGYNTGNLNLAIFGTGFQTGASVKLAKLGNDDINGSGILVISSTEIMANLDLSGKNTGTWTVMVTNPDLTTATLPDGFTVQTLITSDQALNSPNPFDPDKGPTTIVYKLKTDAGVSVLIFDLSHNLIYKVDMSGKAGENSINWNGVNSFGESIPNGLYFCRIVDRGSGNVLAKGRIAISR